MKKVHLLLTIFFITFSTIIVEVLYTRVFSMVYYSSFAFLMISLALFGYGLSGVFMSLSKLAKKKNALAYLEYFILSYAILLPIIYKITLTAKIDFLQLFNPITNLFLLLLNFVVLLIPFFVSGVSLVLIFTLYSDSIGKLYFVDLIGAALGAVILIPLIINFGPSRIILLIYFIFAILWFAISRLKMTKKIPLFLLLVFSFLALYKYSPTLFPVVPKMKKREYLRDYRKNKIEYSQWSPINKIDIAPYAFSKRKVVWLNGGTQQSWLIYSRREIERRKGPLKWIHPAIPYQLTPNRAALIIGSAGGFEVLCALTHNVREIVAVEMDPAICHIVSRSKYTKYIGNIFQRRGVQLLNDEGRSYLKRTSKKFDVIQMVNSHPTDTLLSGGLSVAETYIYTVESFKDYWKHLSDGGFLSIIHVFGERMFTTAFQALKEMKVPEPEKKFFVIQAEKGFNYFFMKKGNINAEETEILEYFTKKFTQLFEIEIVYAPHQKKDNIYYKLISPDSQKIMEQSSVNISPVRDNSPYFNQANKIGQFGFKNNYVKGMAKVVIQKSLLYSNSVYLTILFATLLFSFIFIYLPLRMKSRVKTDRTMVTYFFLIGMAFIIVEIILIKIFQLFLGNPAYSISIIIFSLLLSSGVGSLLSGKISQVFKKRTILFLTIFVVLVLIIFSFFLFDIVYSLIRFGLFLRFVISFLLISVVGLPMGIFFPTGLKYLGETNKSMIGWAWGANAFATVLGSVITVIVAINWNFTVTLNLGAISYLIAGILFHLHLKKSN